MPKVPELLNVLQKYKLEKLIGVARLHKHFDLQPDEYVIWKFNG